jgi:hypothetical protein
VALGCLLGVLRGRDVSTSGALALSRFGYAPEGW